MKTQSLRNRLKTASKSNIHIQHLARSLRSLYRKYRRGIRIYPGIPGRVHYNDDSFYSSSPDHYISVGLSAMENIEHALRLANKNFQDVRSCLDFPCGYGRITRVLQAGLSEAADLDVCDVVPEAIGFCAQEFGATPILSQEDISQITFPKNYDLIWIGSLLTHLDKKSFIDTLKLASDNLEEEGILVFSTHGSYSLEIIDSYGIQNLNRKDVEQHLKKSGFYFAPYSGENAYGISLNTDGFVRSLLEEISPHQMNLLFFKQRGWDNHQDVFACQKSARRVWAE
jgi:SAM-dependent methyltransferase